MLIYILAWVVIGLIIAVLNNHLYSTIQPKEKQYEENSSMLIAMMIWIFLWPIGLFTLCRYLYIKYQ